MPSLSQKIKSNHSSQPQEQPPHLIVQARAGTGKTTTIIQGLRNLKGLPTSIQPSPQQKDIWESLSLSRDARTICFVAFNKQIAAELKSKVPPGCEAKTLHSMGFSTFLRAYPDMRGKELNEGRNQDLVAEITGESIWELRRNKSAVLTNVSRLVDLLKVNLVGLGPDEGEDLPAEITRLARDHEIELNGTANEVLELVPKVLARSLDPKAGGMIGYTDMVWLPVALDLPVFRFDLLLIDERQDLNKCQMQLALRAGKRIVAVGDDKQSIYGFAGADSAACANFKTLLEGTGRRVQELPLTVTYRCGREIVRAAQEFVPDYTAHESNPPGKIAEALYTTRTRYDSSGQRRTEEVPYERTYLPLVQSGDMVLCRANAPLVNQCLKLIRLGRRANIIGRDVGAGIVALAKKLWKTTSDGAPPSVLALLRNLSDWHSEETAKENTSKNPSESKLQAIQDRRDCLHAFADEIGTHASFEALERKIQSVFTESKDDTGIRLSSVHKAKGLEARRVFILVPPAAPMPHPKSVEKGGWQLEQEYNILYVAITRCIEELYWVR